MAQTNNFYLDLCQRSFKKRNIGRKLVIENLSYLDPPKLNKESEFDGIDAGLFGIFLKSAVKLLSRDEVDESEFHMYNSDRSIQYDSVNMALKTLRLLGNSIERLELKLNGIDSEVSKLIIQYVNRFCSESLIELDINVRFNRGDLPQHFIKPFTKLEHFSIKGEFPTSDRIRAAMSSNQTFPNLRSLHIETKHTTDGGYFDCYFPHLKSLNMCGYGFSDDLLKMSPHIHTLGVGILTSGIMEHIILMPELKHLTISEFSHSVFEKEFVIEKVTNLTITAAWTPARNVRFPNLQQLKISFFVPNYNKWMNFFRENNNLKEFHLNHTILIDNEFDDITSTMHDIEEVFISSDKRHTIPAASIIRFIETHQKLVKLCLETCENFDKETLKSRFSQDWTINNYHNGLSFERKELHDSN